MPASLPSGLDPKLQQTIDFVVEADKLKTILRRTILIDRSRRENAAEHSWHLGLMAIVLENCAPPGIDLLRVLKMLLVHDLVEIHAGDTYAYGGVSKVDETQNEAAAANALFALLPAERGRELLGLWEEFEALESEEARFCKALDRLQPVLHNYCTEGRTWQENGIVPDQVRVLARQVADGSEVLGRLIGQLIDEAERRGYFGATEPQSAPS